MPATQHRYLFLQLQVPLTCSVLMEFWTPFLNLDRHFPLIMCLVKAMVKTLSSLQRHVLTLSLDMATRISSISARSLQIGVLAMSIAVSL